MLATHGAALPHRWIAGDDEMGRPYGLRRRLARLGERSLRAVPSNTTIRALEAPPPEYGGKGRHPTHPWQSVGARSQALDEAAWRRIDVRDGSQGPLVVEVVKWRVASRTHRRQQGDEELLTVIRSRDRDQNEVVKVDYYLSTTVPETSLAELARVARLHTASKNVSSVARAKRVWPIMRSAIGPAGSIIKRSHYWRRGF